MNRRVERAVDEAVWRRRLGQRKALETLTEPCDLALQLGGLEITVYSSDTNRRKGHPARQGPGVLRWVLFEAAMAASKAASPDHEYFSSLRERLGTQQAAVADVRKLARWCDHQLPAVDDRAFPVAA